MSYYTDRARAFKEVEGGIHKGYDPEIIIYGVQKKYGYGRSALLKMIQDVRRHDIFLEKARLDVEARSREIQQQDNEGDLDEEAKAVLGI